MGDTDDIVSAIEELSRNANGEHTNVHPAIIDLTLDVDDVPHQLSTQNPSGKVDDSDIRQPQAGPSNAVYSVTSTNAGQQPAVHGTSSHDLHEIQHDVDLTYFSDNETKASLQELLGCLTTDELRCIARQLKIRPAQKVSIMSYF
jgi:hypothetical protein